MKRRSAIDRLFLWTCMVLVVAYILLKAYSPYLTYFGSLVELATIVIFRCINAMGYVYTDVMPYFNIYNSKIKLKFK